MNILRLSTFSLTLAFAVFALGYVDSASAVKPGRDCDPPSNHPSCGGGEDPPPSGTVVLDIEYVRWGGRTHDNHVQIRVQVLADDQPVEADVIIIVDVCPSNDFMLIEDEEGKLVCSDLSDPVHFNFPGTTSVDDGERFNIQNAPIGCYITTVDGVLIGGVGIVSWTQSDDEFCKLP